MNLTNDNLIVLGTSNENWGNPQNPLALSGTQDGFLVEISTKGNLLWNTFFGGVGLDSVQMLEITNDQNLLVMGLSDESWGNPINPFTLNQNNIVIAKFDPSGKLLWNTFAGTIDPYSPATAMDTSKQTSDIFIASSWGSALVTKLDKNGNQLWNNRIGLQTNSVGSLEINSNNEIFICGGSASSNWGNYPDFHHGKTNDAYVAKLDQGGFLIWNAFMGGDSDDYAVRMHIAKDGNSLIILGASSYNSWGNPRRALSVYPGTGDAFLAKISDVK